MHGTLTLLITIVSLAGGCQAATPAQGATPSPVAQPSEVLVEYRRSGGLIGADDRLVIRLNGLTTRATRGGRQEFTLPEATLAQLTAALERADFPALRERYEPKSDGADRFGYTVIYQGKTVRATDDAVPATLQPALQLLNGILAQPAS